MINIIRSRFQQGHRTINYPKQPVVLPDRFRGRPVIDATRCSTECTICADSCPTVAIDISQSTLDLGKCLFCTDCADACPTNAISCDSHYRLAARKREDLIVSAAINVLPQMTALAKESLRLFGRSFKLRQVSAGGCNACEADTNVLSTIVYDLGRFGIQFVASPRHADGLLITGPVTENMRAALLKTYEATPSPKIVIVAGACAISGGIFRDHPETHNGVDGFLPIDLYIPGCPPHPMTILDGLLRLLGRIK